MNNVVEVTVGVVIEVEAGYIPMELLEFEENENFYLSACKFVTGHHMTHDNKCV